MMDLASVKHGLAAKELFLVGDVLLSKEQHESYLAALAASELADIQQGVRKVLLNSLYGALLSAWMRFGDPRLGASTTYSGRQITTKMVNTATELLGSSSKLKKTVHHVKTNKRDGTVETKIENEYTLDLGPTEAGVIYSDTDSAYFTMRGLVQSTDEAVALADAVNDEVNAAFPEFMQLAFNCQPGFETLIRANRELVCRTALLQAKKKYMLAVVDKEGKRIEPGSPDELKTMGSDIKLSSTPEVIRAMLKSVVMQVLDEAPRDEINAAIMKFRRALSSGSALDPLTLATVQSVKELDKYQRLVNLAGDVTAVKITVPSAVRAAMNYNATLIKRSIVTDKPIAGGDKVKILWLIPNPDGFTNIAFPSDVEVLPVWFKELYSVDMVAMEQKLVDQKLQNIFDALGWEVPTEQTELTGALLEF